jgi:hypothetical protein
VSSLSSLRLKQGVVVVLDWVPVNHVIHEAALVPSCPILQEWMLWLKGSNNPTTGASNNKEVKHSDEMETRPHSRSRDVGLKQKQGQSRSMSELSKMQK